MVGAATILRLQQAPGADWRADGQGAAFDWLVLLGRIGGWALLALVLLLVVRAVLRRRRYRAVDVLTQADRDKVAERIAAAERRTVGEIVVVVLERSDRHPGANWLAALVSVLLGSTLLVAWLPWDRPGLLLTSQLLLGALGWACARWLPDFASLFVSDRRASEVTSEQALQEFYAAGVHRTEAATGVLIFVSLLEHRVIVLGDEGIDARVDAALWAEVDQAVLAGIRRGCLHEGLLQGVDVCARVLAEHFPWREGDRDELPNHLVVRRE